MTTDLKEKKATRAALNRNGQSPFATRHRLKEIKERRHQFRFEHEGEWYEAVYNHAAVTIGFQGRMAELEDKTDGEQIIGTLTALLLDWDLVGADGETPLPVSDEEFRELPIPFLVALLKALWEDYRGPEAPSEPTSGSFS